MKKQHLMNKLLDHASFSEENVPLQPLVELCGEKRVLIENHGGVTEYSDNRIGVAVRFGAIVITGEKLRLHKMTKCQLVICGSVQSIQLLKG